MPSIVCPKTYRPSRSTVKFPGKCSKRIKQRVETTFLKYEKKRTPKGRKCRNGSRRSVSKKKPGFCVKRATKMVTKQVIDVVEPLSDQQVSAILSSVRSSGRSSASGSTYVPSRTSFVSSAASSGILEEFQESASESPMAYESPAGSPKGRSIRSSPIDKGFKGQKSSGIFEDFQESSARSSAEDSSSPLSIAASSVAAAPAAAGNFLNGLLGRLFPGAARPEQVARTEQISEVLKSAELEAESGEATPSKSPAQKAEEKVVDSQVKEGLVDYLFTMPSGTKIYKYVKGNRRFKVNPQGRKVFINTTNKDYQRAVTSMARAKGL